VKPFLHLTRSDAGLFAEPKPVMDFLAGNVAADPELLAGQ
jgi:hypothetical protein